MDNTDITTEITVVVDSSSVIGDEYASSGLSLLIERTNETVNEKILFDTGFQGDALLRNLDELDVDVTKIENIVLSHGHFDHSGGLSAVLGKTEKKPRLFCNGKIFREKIYGRKDEGKDVGITAGNNVEFIYSHAEVVPTGDAVEIIPGLWTVSDVPRIHENEKISGKLDNIEVLNEDGNYSKDELSEDTSLVIEAGQDEIILIVGCGHSGIMNLIDLIHGRYPQKHLIGIIGGLQLHEKSREVILEVTQAVRSLELLFFCPLHSTGDEALDIFEKELGDVFVRGGVGLQIVFS
ncbi:MAG: MBL fold metallo-hydrolase [Spirochaetales bacterium]|nr:MBL fold metallo-hydrolase [Spirochaetales bacterium]